MGSAKLYKFVSITTSRPNIRSLLLVQGMFKGKNLPKFDFGNFMKYLPIMLFSFPIMPVLCSKVIQYVTVHAKTSLVRTKIKIHFLPQLYYICTLATCTACLPWPDSIGLLFWGVDLRSCKTMTDTLAPVEHANWV